MNKITSFFRNSYEELTQHVTWPSRTELNNQTVLVLVASVIFAIVIGLMDFGFKTLMQTIYDINS